MPTGTTHTNQGEDQGDDLGWGTTRKTKTVTLTFDCEDMARRGKLGAQVTHSRYDAKDLTKAGRKAFMARFEREVDPNGELPPEEREKRARQARVAYMKNIARSSAETRRKKKEAALAYIAAMPEH